MPLSLPIVILLSLLIGLAGHALDCRRERAELAELDAALGGV